MVMGLLIAAAVVAATVGAEPAPPPLFELQSTATCGANETSHITSPTECSRAAVLLALDGADDGVYVVHDMTAGPAEVKTYGCAHSQAVADFGVDGAVRFNSVGVKTGNGTDAVSTLKIKSICRTAEGAAAAAATDYALGLHNTTTTCATGGRAVTTYYECIHAAVIFRGVEITSSDNFDDFIAEHFDYHSQPLDSIGVCYHSFDDKVGGNYRYTDGKFHFNTNITVPTELMSAVCAVPKKEELCAADGDFVKGTMGDSTCPDGTVTIDTPEECMLAARTTLKLIPYNSPMNGPAGVMSTESIFTGETKYHIPPNCSYDKSRARGENYGNGAVINFNSNYDETALYPVLGSHAPLCRCEAPPPPPPGPPPLFELQTTATCGANGTSHITSPTECGYAAAQLLQALPHKVNIKANRPGGTKGCAVSQVIMEIDPGTGFWFNAIGNTYGNGTDAGAPQFVKSICRMAEGAAAAAATDYALGLHNTTTTCATGRAVTTYHECLHAAVTNRGVEITSSYSLKNFKTKHFDSHSQPADSIGVCYHSFDDKVSGNYQYTDGKFHFNTNTTVPTELMSTVCAVPKEGLCAADGDFVEGTKGDATCPDGTVTIDTPEECMLAAKTTLKLIPYNSPMNGSDGAMSTRSISGDSSVLKMLPNCSYWKSGAQGTNDDNRAVINFNSNYDDTTGTASLAFAPLCRCEAPPPPPPPPPPLFELQTTATCGANGTSHITSTTECGWAAQLLALDGADEYAIIISNTAAADEKTYGCAHSQATATAGFDSGAVRFNSIGVKTGNGTDVGANLFVKSICRTAEGAAAATDYALGLHNTTTTTCATGGRAVTTYAECLYAAIAIRGMEITSTTGLNNFKTDNFDRHGQPADSIGGVCYHSFDDNVDGSYRYTDGKFHFNTNTTVPTELMSTICAVPKEEELCAADGDFVEGTRGDATCPDGTVTIDTPEECMLAAKTTLKLIPYNSPMNGPGGAMYTASTGGGDIRRLPNCSYNKDRAQGKNTDNDAVINFNYDNITGTVSAGDAPLCRCEAPPPSPARPRQVISTTAAGGTTTAKPKDSSNSSTVMIVIIVIVAFIAVGGITFLIYINPEKFKFGRSTDADMNAQML